MTNAFFNSIKTLRTLILDLTVRELKAFQFNKQSSLNPYYCGTYLTRVKFSNPLISIT